MTKLIARVYAGSTALVAAAALAACGSSETTSAAARPTLPSVTPESSAATSSPASSSAAAATNERGNISKQLGEEGGISDEDDNEVLTFAIDKIKPNTKCTEDYADDPENDNFTAVTMRVATSAALDTDGYYTVSATDFKFIGADGVTVDGLDTVNTYGCLNDKKLFTQDSLGKSQKYTGQIVLDVPDDAGTLLFEPAWGQSGGWEYTF